MVVIPSEVRRQTNEVEGPCVFRSTTFEPFLTADSDPAQPTLSALPALMF